MHVYPNYYKKFISQIYKKKFSLVNIRMINLSFDELKLIAQVRNISDYENKSKEDLIKVNQDWNHQNQKYQNQK